MAANAELLHGASLRPLREGLSEALLPASLLSPCFAPRLLPRLVIRARIAQIGSRAGCRRSSMLFSSSLAKVRRLTLRPSLPPLPPLPSRPAVHGLQAVLERALWPPSLPLASFTVAIRSVLAGLDFPVAVGCAHLLPRPTGGPP
jgi:hypothetical protein